jgi:hypothetical protein
MHRRTGNPAIPEPKSDAVLGADMQWIEALINMFAFAGFVGVANCWPKHQSAQ